MLCVYISYVYIFRIEFMLLAAIFCGFDVVTATSIPADRYKQVLLWEEGREQKGPVTARVLFQAVLGLGLCAIKKSRDKRAGPS